MHIYITGGGTNNKGALSMLEVTIDNLKKIYGDDTIFYIELLERKNWKSVPRCIPVRCDRYSYLYALRQESSYSLYLKTVKKVIKSHIKRILGRTSNVYQLQNLYAIKQIIDKIDAAYDISGFSLSSKWDPLTNKLYLERIRLLERHHVPYILLPQSFGPFNYKQDQNCIITTELIKNELSKAKAIFAREPSGYELLKNKLNLNNVYLSNDIVLMSRDNFLNFHKPEIDNKIVGIVPNLKISSSIEQSKSIYCNIIRYLLSKNCRIMIINHTSFDVVLCRAIKKCFPDDTVQYLENDYGPLEYKQCIAKVEFLIASRYHSIIHAYQVDTPCIILAWAEKYQILASLFDQERFVFDAVQTETTCDMLFSQIDVMLQDFQNQSKIIHHRYLKLMESEQNAFGVVEEILTDEKN